MRIHVQRVYRTNRKTNIGNDSVFDGLVNYDAHCFNLGFRNYDLGFEPIVPSNFF